MGAHSWGGISTVGSTSFADRNNKEFENEGWQRSAGSKERERGGRAVGLVGQGRVGCRQSYYDGMPGGLAGHGGPGQGARKAKGYEVRDKRLGLGARVRARNNE